MTKLNWNRGGSGGGYSIERSPYRPYTASELLRGRTQRKPKPTVEPAPPTLETLMRGGVNRLSIWCMTCRLPEHRDATALGIEIQRLPLDQLGQAVRCAACGGTTTASPFTEGPLRRA